MRTLKALACVALSASPAISHAQAGAYFEAGGARVRYGDTVNVSAGTLSASASALTPSASFAGLVAASTTRQSTWTMFGSAQGSLFAPARGALRGELHGGGSLTTYGEGSGSGQLLGGARAHLARPTGGGWLGAAAGSVKDPVGWRSLTAAELGAWVQLGPVTAQGILLPVRIAGGVRYADVEATARFGSERFEAVGVGGVRTSVQGYDDSPGAWASVNAVAWVARSVGITAGFGNYPADPGQDLPGARYATLGVRWTPARMRRAQPVLSADVLGAAPVARAPAMRVVNGPAGRRTVLFSSPMAQRVEIMGDFTDWAPVQMKPAQPPGTWAISLPIAGGVHQVNVRLDGGEWVVPAGLTAIRDEFGGAVGILLVP